MASQKDKDYHKLRNPKKYGLVRKRQHVVYEKEDGTQGIYHAPMTIEEAEADKAYDKLWYKYGGKSMVSDKRRRCSTRKSNQRFKVTMRRIDRARNKEEARKEINGNLF